MERGPVQTGGPSKLVSIHLQVRCQVTSKLKSGSSHWIGSQTKIPGGLHGWARSYWQKSTQRSIQKVEMGTGNQEGIQRHYLSVQGWGWESQSPVGIENGITGKWYIKANKVGFFKYIGDKRMTEISMGLFLNFTPEWGREHRMWKKLK